jgi:hypothetical protein
LTPQAYVRLLVKAPPGFIEGDLAKRPPDVILGAVEELSNRLRLLKEPDTKEYQSVADTLGRVTINFPGTVTNGGTELRKAFAERLRRVLDLKELQYRAAILLRILDLDPDGIGRTCRDLCAGIDHGVSVDEYSYEQVLAGLSDATFRDIDVVLTLLKGLRRDFSSSGVEEFVAKLEVDLRVKGFTEVFGPSLRKYYAKKVLGPNLSEKKDPILILGPSGSSKSFLAEKIALNSVFPDYRRINCGGKVKHVRKEIDDTLEAARALPTSICFDEVYALPKSIQVEVLVPLGDKTYKLRVLAASSRDEAYLASKLIADFRARIKGWTLELKPLKDCREDLDDSIRGWARLLRIDIEPRVVDWLCDNYDWPENQREVEAVMRVLGEIVCRNGAPISVDSLTKARTELTKEIRRILDPLIGP